MTQYETFARFYDAVMGHDPHEARDIRSLMARHAPKAARVLELACGTGLVLQGLPTNLELHGLDRSSEMLAQARRRLPKARFAQQDMSRFRLPGTFDAVLCLADAINHLTTLTAWERMFDAVRRHLGPRGIFIFQIFVPAEAKAAVAREDGLLCQPFGKDNLMLMRSRSRGRDRYTFDFTFFERLPDGLYRRHTDRSDLLIPSVATVRRLAGRSFSRIQVMNGRGRPRPMSDGDAYWVCRP